MISVKIIERKKPHNGSRLDLHVGSDFSQTISLNKTLSKATYIWKFVQRQLPHSGFGLQYRRILFGYQARTFHFSFFNVSHKSLSFITWNLIEYLHTQDFQRATAHLNVWTNILLFCFVYGCKQHTKISWQNPRGGNLFSRFALPSTLTLFINLNGLILLILLSFLLYFYLVYSIWINAA